MYIHFFFMSRATRKQSGENSLTSVEELKDIKENLSSLFIDVADVLRNQKQMQQLIDRIQNLQKNEAKGEKKSNSWRNEFTTLSSTPGKTIL